jgi:hypothetical protein
MAFAPIRAGTFFIDALVLLMHWFTVIDALVYLNHDVQTEQPEQQGKRSRCLSGRRAQQHNYSRPEEHLASLQLQNLSNA